MSVRREILALLQEYEARPKSPISEQRKKWVKLGRSILDSEGKGIDEFDLRIEELYMMGQISRNEMDHLYFLLSKQNLALNK